jgi:hypothetical protein
MIFLEAASASDTRQKHDIYSVGYTDGANPCSCLGAKARLWDLQIKLTWCCSPSSRVSCSPSRTSACARNSAHKESAGSCSWSSKSTDSASSFAEACDRKNKKRKQILGARTVSLHPQLIYYTEVGVISSVIRILADTALRLYCHTEQVRLSKNTLRWSSQWKIWQIEIATKALRYVL